MSRVRVFLLWLMMLAVPFQGYAAASMALCGTAESAAKVAMADSHAGHSDHVAASHADADDGSANTSHAHSDASPKCSSCVTCHAVALTGDMQVNLLHALPEADLAEPASTMADPASRVPDKPPRA